MLKTLISYVIGGCMFALTAGNSPIGVVRSNGEFRVDGAAIRGNTTLFDGNLVETTSAGSVLQVGGVQIALLPDSSIRVFRDHIEAGTLSIATTTKDGAMRVQTSGKQHVAIAALTGTAEVRNAAGSLVAMVHPGLALALEPQAAADTQFQMTGVLESKDGKFFLTDLTANVKVELLGPDPKYVGKTVEVHGSIIPGASAAAGASQVVRVISITPAKAATAGGAAASAAGHSTAGTIAIIGGIAVGGTAAGLGAAGTFSGQPSLSAK
jgi:hypothetical protein